MLKCEFFTVAVWSRLSLGLRTEAKEFSGRFQAPHQQVFGFHGEIAYAEEVPGFPDLDDFGGCRVVVINFYCVSILAQQRMTAQVGIFCQGSCNALHLTGLPLWRRP